MFATRPMLATCILACLASPICADDERAYRVLAADKGHVAIVNAKGEVEWEFATKAEVHDLALLENGNVLFPTGPATVVEMTPEKKVVWQYNAKQKAGYTGRIEIHAFQRLVDGRTMVAESGNARIVEVDGDGKVATQPPHHPGLPDEGHLDQLHHRD